MKINIKQAVKLFFANPSLEMVYFEVMENNVEVLLFPMILMKSLL